ncbi:MAG TPA: acyl-ACP desaturase [Acidimicrobiales bacterium]
MDAATIAFLADLEPTVEALLERHLESAKEWFPHEVVPWSRGRDFEEDEQWDPREVPMDDSLRSALFVNLLTEDNLPYYFATIDGTFGPDGAWGTWARRWTAEEGRHSIAIRDYLTVTRALDPRDLERARMAQVSTGQVPDPDAPRDAIAYVALQELATRISHRNTGRLLDDPAGFEVMKRVAGDENRHYLFYRDLVQQALEVDPNGMVCAIARQVLDFAMPGTGIIDFTAHARRIADAGIYDFVVHHDQILVPVVLTQWRLAEIEGLNGEAEQARAAALHHIERIGKAARRLEARRERRAARSEPVGANA